MAHPRDSNAPAPGSRRAGLRWTVAIAVLSMAVAAAGAIDWRSPRREGAPRILSAETRSGALLAGAGRARVDLPDGAVLAGYRPFGREAGDDGRAIHARSLILEVGGLRSAIVLVELMTLPPSLASRIDERVQAAGVGCSVIAATHTHSGPGGYDRALLPQAVAVGRFDVEVEDAILDAVSASLALARAELAPAELATGEGTLPFGRNRDRPGSPVDDRLTGVRLLRPDGAWVARIVRFAAHPTLEARAFGPAGDWPGAAMAALEEEGGVALVLQGAVGDVRADLDAARDPGGEAARDAESFGGAVARATAALGFHEVAAPVAMGCAAAEFDLPEADLDAMVPWPMGRLVSNLASVEAPGTSRISALRLDDLVLLAVPAEPTFGAARLAEEAVGRMGLRGRIVSLAQGYVGYAPLPEDVEARVFSSRYSWFGSALVGRLTRGTEAAAAALLARPAGERELSDRPDDTAAADGSTGEHSR